MTDLAGRWSVRPELRRTDGASPGGWSLLVIEGAADDPALEQPQAFLGALRTDLADSTGGLR